MNKNKLKEAILKTLIYSDIFDFPLKREEIGKWLIQNNNIIRKIKDIQHKNGFYFLNSRENIVEIRRQREKYSSEKLKIAKKASFLLKIIPSIKLVGITGALAMKNTKKDDDIDLFIITSKNLLWTTRLLATILIELTGLRRRPHDLIASNKICLNMFMDEAYLEIPKKEQDLFTAHEVLQMKPLLNRNNIFRKFLSANLWTRKYLPNVFNIKYKKENIKNTYKKINIFSSFSFIERFLKKLQLRYMKKRRTTEVLKNGYIRFHPHDARKWILDRYNQKLKEFHLTP